MGGDNAPDEVVRGAIEATRRLGVGVVLAGPPRRIEPILAEAGGRLNVEIAPAEEVIGFEESPVQALRLKPNASLPVAVDLVQSGRCAAMVSAGNTGALMAASLLKLGRVSGLRRPGLMATLPGVKGGAMLLIDVGASADARPEQLQQYAVAGSLYAEHVMGIASPRVGLLNIGAEANKGSELVRTAYGLIGQTDVNFVGNVEARDLPDAPCDVVVTDGFVGNVVLKLIEGLGMGFFSLLRSEVGHSSRGRIGAMLLRPALRRMIRRMDYAEYGGAPLIGPRGAIIKCHGSSGAQAIMNGIRVGRDLVEGGFLEAMEQRLGEA